MWNDLARRLILATGTLLLIAAVGSRVQSAEPKKLVVYSPSTTYSVDVIDRKGSEYVGLVELLEPLGHVEAKSDGRSWVLEFANSSHTSRAKFRDGKKDVELPSGKLSLHSNFFTQDSHGYVPIENLQEIVAQLAGTQTQLHLPARHLYLGGVGIRYTTELRKNPGRIVISFTAPVAPSISAEGNILRLTFTRDPLMSSGNDAQDFKDPTIQSTSFAETNAGAELIVRGGGPLVANSSDGGRTLTIQTSQSLQASNSTSAQPQPAATQPAATTPAKPETPLPPPLMPPAQSKPQFLVVVDAAHGGEDIGATLSANFQEKDFDLTLSRRIAHELQNRGIQVTLLRNADNSIAPDQRAITTNTAHAAVYLSVHASSVGHGVRVFTSLMPPTPVAPGRHAFIPWDAAQSQYLDRSSAVSGSIAFECNRKQLAVKALQGSVSPLNNIATAAVAIEVAPLDGTIESLNTTEYQQNVAVAIANGIAAIRATEGEKKR